MGESKNYEESKVVEQLNRKADLRVVGKQIQHLKDGKGDVGNGTKGKIDFLTKYCGYTYFYVSSFKH